MIRAILFFNFYILNQRIRLNITLFNGGPGDIAKVFPPIPEDIVKHKYPTHRPG